MANLVKQVDKKIAVRKLSWPTLPQPLKIYIKQYKEEFSSIKSAIKICANICLSIMSNEILCYCAENNFLTYEPFF